MWIARIISLFVTYVLLGGMVAGAGLFWIIETYGNELPSREAVVNHQPATITRLHAADGTLIAEYASKHRLFIPIEAIPKRVQQAFISAEDKSFFEHPGINLMAVAKSIPNNLHRTLQGRRLVGSSTITQQVAKNFVVGDARAISRKLRELFTALEIEKEISKNDILEIYLNEIYFGQRAYGIAAAALLIFNKSVEELELHEAAYLAAVIKGPENYHPIEDAERAIERRNWVIGQMLENGFVSKAEAEAAQAMPIGAKLGAYRKVIVDSAPYFAEEVRKELVRDYGISEVNEGGLSVRTTVDLEMQAIADDVLRSGLLDYDKRHGYRGPLAQLDMSVNGWQQRIPQALSEIERPKGCDGWHMAAVLDVGARSAIVELEDGSQARIRLEDSLWAAEPRDKGAVGDEPDAMDQIVQPGDVVMVELAESLAGDRRLALLQQKPEVNGALVAMSPHTGRVVAMSGGWSFADSEWNRAVQARRQPGSTIKPFVFLAALDQGFSPRSQILDSPVVYEQPDGTIWRPGNYDGRFLGQQPMRVGLEKSRNLMTVRLASAVGMDTVTTYAKRFGIGDGFKPYLSSALGATEATLIDMTTAYAMLANGGRQIVPTFVDRIQDRKGKTLFRHDQRPCSSCSGGQWQDQAMPVLLDDRVQMADPVSIFQIQSMLRGVVERGTARNTVGKVVDRPVAGKTGTTNKYQDAWFVGFTPDLVVGTYIGFDTPRTLGRGEGGGSAAAPMFAEFVNRALDGTPPQDFRIPRGIVLTGVDPSTGMIAEGTDGILGDVLMEATRSDREFEQTYTDESGYITTERDGSTAGAKIF